MIVTFDKEYLSKLYHTGRTNGKKHRFQPEVIRKYKHCIDILLYAPDIEALYPFKSLAYEVLVGDKRGISSIRVNRQYRIEFAVHQEVDETVVTICNILDLSNHYK
jgi:hypothetical protein